MTALVTRSEHTSRRAVKPIIPVFINGPDVIVRPAHHSAQSARLRHHAGGRERWRDEAGEHGEKLKGREGEDGAAVAGGSRGQVEDLADAGIAVCCGGGALFDPLAAALDTQAPARRAAARHPPAAGTRSQEALSPR
jgi:hypothetical protein